MLSRAGSVIYVWIERDKYVDFSIGAEFYRSISFQFRVKSPLLSQVEQRAWSDNGLSCFLLFSLNRSQGDGKDNVINQGTT